MPAPNQQVCNMNVHQLRTHISNLMREDFSDRLNELERLLNEAVLELEQKESKPPRSDFWDLRVLIIKENQSNYNRINNTEVIAAMYCALQLHNVGKPDEIALSCRSGEAYGELVTHLADFKVDDFPQDLRTMCNNFFPSVTSFEFFLKKKRTVVSGESGEHTETALMLTARANMHTLIIEIEEVKEKLQSMIDANLPKLRELLKDPLETRADSDAESSSDEESDDEALDEDGRPNKPSPKRRKTFDEMGTTKDTWLQHVSNFGIQCSPGQAVKNTRIREFRGEPEWHYVELMGALNTYKACIIDKKLPVPRAPTFSHGADDELGPGGSFKLVCPGEDVNSNTAVTQKMMDEDSKNGTTLIKDYEEMQNLARIFRKKISDLVRMYNNEFEFVVRANDATDRRDYHVNQLSLMQKYAIGQLYLDAIAVNKNPEPAEEVESESEGESDEEDSGSDCSYASEEDASDDDDDDEDDSDASGGDDDESGDSDDE
jgi:hypothetical protein